MISASIHGEKALLRDLERMESEASVEVRAGVREASTECQKDARAAARKRTGIMARKIKRSTRKRGLEADVFCDDFKAIWHEFGTVKMEPQPFIIPAFEQAAEKFTQRMEALAARFR